MKRITAIVLLVLCIFTGVDARSIYVSQAGNDNNAGTRQAPYKTLAKAGRTHDQTAGGNLIFIKRGEVFNEVFPFIKQGNLTVDAYGNADLAKTELVSADNSVVIHSFNRTLGPVTFRNLRITGAIEKGGSFGVRWMSSVDGLTFEDMYISGFSQNIMVESYNGSVIKNVEISRCVIVDARGASRSQAVYIGKEVDGIYIHDSLFHKSGLSGTSTQSHLVYLHSHARRSRVHGNIFAMGRSHGLQARNGGEIYRNCFIANAINAEISIVRGGSTATPDGTIIDVQNNLAAYAQDISIDQPRGWGIGIANVKAGVFKGNAVVLQKSIRPQSAQGFYISGQEGVGINDLEWTANFAHGYQVPADQNVIDMGFAVLPFPADKEPVDFDYKPWLMQARDNWLEGDFTALGLVDIILNRTPSIPEPPVEPPIDPEPPLPPEVPPHVHDALVDQVHALEAAVQVLEDRQRSAGSALDP